MRALRWALGSRLQEGYDKETRELHGEVQRCPFSFSPVLFLVGRGPNPKIDYRKSKGALILTSLLEDLLGVGLVVFKENQEANMFVCRGVWGGGGLTSIC